MLQKKTIDFISFKPLSIYHLTCTNPSNKLNQLKYKRKKEEVIVDSTFNMENERFTCILLPDNQGNNHDNEDS